MYATQDRSEVNLNQYLDILRRRWIYVVGTVVILVGFTLYTDLRATPVYRASTQMLLQGKQSDNILNPFGSPTDPARALQNELRIVNSSAIREAVAKEYGSPVSVTATAGGDDDVFILSATADNGEEAAERVNTYASVYQTSRLTALTADIVETKKVVQEQIDAFQAQVDEINAPVAELDNRILLTDPSSLEYSRLNAQREQVRQQTDAERAAAQASLDQYKTTLNQLQLSERLNTTGGVQVLNPATVPSAPISPTIMTDVIQALAVGLFLGIAAAFLRDQLDDSLRTKDDLERAIKDLPVIGVVPLDHSWRESSSPTLVTATDPMSAVAEAYRGLRTAIQYIEVERPTRVLQVTSSGSGEGKTTVVSNLALAFAQAGKRVAVVGCDLRKPRIHRFLQVDGNVGFTSVVLGDLTLDEALQTSPLHPNIDVLASGPRPPNPSELLSVNRTARIIEELAGRYSIVLLDCPPVLPVTDALVLSRCVDGAIYLAAANRTTRRVVRHGVDLLSQVGCPMLGTVLNGVPVESTYNSFLEYYGYTSRSRIPFLDRLLGRRGPDTAALTRTALPVGADEGEGQGEPEAPSETMVPTNEDEPATSRS
ncbi:MAG: polysaccharide biosynthesis tyrosine autokinase [Acidimicrobiales bacterium]|nr:polysaccharide biosynthesis tyrosine autokinase [Acidimicrobiales bacterium]HRW36554.1 polysaccharide biosynthesis tyrosine autokinase [Aquihabitans sp.]